MEFLTRIEPFLEDPEARAHYYGLPKVGAGFAIHPFVPPGKRLQLVALMASAGGIRCIGYIPHPCRNQLLRSLQKTFYTGEIIGYQGERDRWVARISPLTGKLADDDEDTRC